MSKHFSNWVVSLGLAAALCFGSQAVAQTVTNGSMTGPVAISAPPPSWVSITGDGDTVPPGGLFAGSFTYDPGIPASPNGGTMLSVLNNNGYGGSFTYDSVGQTINGFTVNQAYTLSFYFANGGLDLANYAGPGGIQADIAGNSFQTSVVPFDGAGSQTWRLVSFNFIATNTSEFLMFTPIGGIQGEGIAMTVDGVAITPEPATMVLLSLVLVGMRKRGR